VAECAFCGRPWLPPDRRADVARIYLLGVGEGSGLDRLGSPAREEEQEEDREQGEKRTFAAGSLHCPSSPFVPFSFSTLSPIHSDFAEE
jgi:hypothetical protein